MKIFFKLSIILFTTTLLLSSCRKDINDSEITEINIPGPEIIELYNGDLDVYITDIYGNSLQDVDVFVYNEKTKTDKFGIAQFKDIPLDANGTFVRALIPGFFFGSDKFFPKGKKNSIVIRMLPLENAKEIDPNSVNQVAVEGGGDIKFQANSFVDKNGTDYNGTVSVYATRINPEAPFSHEIMPGALIAIDDRGNTVGLESYAMLAVELRDVDGNELQLKPGFPATVRFKVDEKLHDAAPQFIPTWSFDEVQGNWIEESDAEFIDGHYVSEVSHFSFWNCDAPFPLVNVTGQVLDENGDPLYGYYVLVKVNGMCASGYTDGEGVFSGKMPKNQMLTFCVFSPGCLDPSYTVTLGPFSENTVLDPFVITTESISLSGTVLCEGAPLENADVYVVFENTTEKYSSSENGEFNIDVSELECQSISEGTLFAINPATGQQSEIIEFQNTSLENIELEVCIDCDVSPYITVDNSDICNSTVVLTVNIDNTTTEFEYEWSNGTTGESATYETSGLHCVVITEPITECSMTICEEVVLADQLDVVYDWNHMFCNSPGYLYFNINGGTAPYDIDVDGPNVGDILGETIEILAPGVYSVTITDSNGCTFTFTKEIEQQGGTFELYISDIDGNGYPALCDGESVQLIASCPNCDIDLNQLVWTLPDGSQVNSVSVIADEPGDYQVHYNDGFCDYVGSLNLFEGSEEYEIEEYLCEGYLNYVILYSVQGVTYSHVLPEIVFQDFPESFSGSFAAPENLCIETIEYDIPYATGVEITNLTPPSCDTCSDGTITVDLSNFSCTCTADQVLIVSQDDIFQTFAEKELVLGDYFLLVLNEEGCIVYKEEFSF